MSNPPTLEAVDERSLHASPNSNNKITVAVIVIVVVALGFGALLAVGMWLTNRDKADLRERVRASRVARGEDPNQSPLVRTVQAQTLVSAYEDNEVSADLNYKGKEIAVSGEVDNVGKDIINTMYVSLKGGSLWGVQCMFDDEHEGELAGLQKGQRVIVQGTVQGKMGNVILRGCSLR